MITSTSLALSSLAAWTFPSNLLKIGPSPSPLDSFTKDPGTVIFLPGLHNCGTLLVLSAEGLSLADLEEAKGMDAMREEWQNAPSKILEDGALEEAVVAWTKGWRKTCGKGKGGGEVRVAKIVVDGLGAGEKAPVEALDVALQTHLNALPPQPHQHLIILTSLSPSALTTLFSVAGGGSSPSQPSSPGDKTIFPHPSRSFGIWGLLIGTVKMLFWLAVFGAICWTAYRWVAERRMRRKGRVMLPLSGDEELDLEAE
ncbi:hypothetical protein P7C70_g5599, partial [Phenoliferia sp. Uapishka_3]